MAKKKTVTKERAKVAATAAATPVTKIDEAPSLRELVVEALQRTEESLKAYNLAGALLSDGQRFIAARGDGKERLTALNDYFKKAEFALASIRDELTICLGKSPDGVRATFTPMSVPVPQIPEALVFTSAPTPEDVQNAMQITGIALGMLAEVQIPAYQSEQTLRVLTFQKRLHESLKAMATVQAPAK